MHSRLTLDASRIPKQIKLEDEANREASIMTDTDRIVAAIFASAMVSQAGTTEHGDYIKAYEEFLHRLEERRGRWTPAKEEKPTAGLRSESPSAV
jgi:hypothetical protein